jgi:nucleotide-binding universal stress UspA family protein
MYDKVVVPLDGSKLAEIALPYAEELAAKMASDIVLFTALDTDSGVEEENSHKYTRKVAGVTRYNAEKYLAEAESTHVHVGTATRTGNPAQAIIDYVSNGDRNIVVMASHGRSGLNRWAVGSVADKVVRGMPRQPVMLVRGKESRSDVREKRILKKALVPLDGSMESRCIVPFMSEIAQGLEMELTLMQVVPQRHTSTFTEAEDYLQGECRELHADGVLANHVVQVGPVADGIIDYAEEYAFDLVAMSTHGRGGVGLWSLGSVAEKVFLGGNTPLLLIRQ